MEEFAVYYGEKYEDITPADAVMRELRWTATHAEWLRLQIQQGETVHVDAYGEERDRLARLAFLAHRMGIEERETTAAETLGGQIASMIEDILSALPLTLAQRGEALASIPERLRGLAS
ncbi:MAG: hypothetical protein ACOYBY_17710 [Dermatophilaceae bacterium]